MYHDITSLIIVLVSEWSFETKKTIWVAHLTLRSVIMYFYPSPSKFCMFLLLICLSVSTKSRLGWYLQHSSQNWIFGTRYYEHGMMTYLVLRFCAGLYGYYGLFLIGLNYGVRSCLEMYYQTLDCWLILLILLRRNGLCGVNRHSDRITRHGIDRSNQWSTYLMVDLMSHQWL